MPRMHVQTADGQWIPMTDTPYESEDYLQRLLAEHPGLMPGELFDSENPRRWLLLTREAGIALAGAGGGSRWSMDHLFVDQDAIPTLVEVKRSSDTRSRREVVAQMLDYAANLWAWGPGEAKSCLESRCLLEDLDPGELLDSFLGPELESGQFWNQVDANITAGRLRLVFLADRIGPELRQIIEFLNSQFARAEVVAVEVRQWNGEGVSTLVSEVIGQTAASAALNKGGRGPRLTHDEFIAALFGRCPREEAKGVEALMTWCENNGGWVSFGAGTSYPACYLNWRRDDAIWALIPTVPGYVSIPFDALSVRAPFDQPKMLGEFRKRMEGIEGVTLTAAAQRPSFPTSVLADTSRLREVQEVLNWFVRQVSSVQK